MVLGKTKRLTRKLERSGLCMERREGEQIYIFLPNGESVLVTLTQASKPGRARLHLAGPPHIKFLRAELLEEPTAA